MRLVANVPHPVCKISIFSYNEKWIIEIEGGQYKQTYKISHDSVSGLDGVKSLLTTELVEGTLQRFNGMHTDFAQAFKLYNEKTS